MEEVKNAQDLPPKTGQKSVYNDLRHRGMYEYNLQFMKGQTLKTEDKAKFMRERQPKFLDEVRMCTGCNRFLSNRTYYKHACASPNAEAMAPFLMATKDVHDDKEFVDEILNCFRDNEAGNLCRKDKLIQQVGYRHFCLRRSESSMRDEVRRNVMSEMRELARLYLAFKELSEREDLTTEDMFNRDHLPTLRKAIEQMSDSDGNKEKHGLKLMLNAIILRTIKSMKGLYTETKQDDKFVEIGKFQEAYLFRSAEMFANARYQCIVNSVDKSRRPESLPDEKEIQKLKTYITSEVHKITKDKFDPANYSTLRSLIVCRLTLYNGRRGEEPARMLVSQWIDARDNVWLPPDKVQEIKDDAEKYLIGKFRLAYLQGKRQKFVPVLLPEDMIKPISLLYEHRDTQKILSENAFLFATKASKRHCSGWHAVYDICRKAQVSVNATTNRHRLSTIYASLDMDPKDRPVFLEHMGHEDRINRENYLCPIGIKEVKVMGRMLHSIDQGDNFIYCSKMYF